MARVFCIPSFVDRCPPDPWCEPTNVDGFIGILKWSLWLGALAWALSRNAERARKERPQ